MYTKVKTGIVLLAGLLLNGCALSYINLTDLDDKKVVTEYKASQDVSRLVVTSNHNNKSQKSLALSIWYVWSGEGDTLIYKPSDEDDRDTIYLKKGEKYKLRIAARLFEDGQTTYTITRWEMTEEVVLPDGGKSYQLQFVLSDDGKTLTSRGIQPGSDL